MARGGGSGWGEEVVDKGAHGFRFGGDIVKCLLVVGEIAVRFKQDEFDVAADRR
mgnify:CR=1 FL=1